jgi:hypothetical protein
VFLHACAESPTIKLDDLRQVPAHMIAKTVTGAEAREMFFKGLAPELVARWVRDLEARGWKPTATFGAYRIVSNPYRLTQSSGSYPTADGAVVIWDWDGPYDHASGLVRVENHSTGAYVLFDITYDPYADGAWGWSTWARLFESRDANGGFTRDASFGGALPQKPRYVKAAAGPLGRSVFYTAAGDAGTFEPSDLAAWRACMRQCMQKKMDTAVRTGMYAGVAGVIPCARHASRSVFGGVVVSLFVFIGCEAGYAAVGAAMGAYHQFAVEPSCESSCGPKPTR